MWSLHICSASHSPNIYHGNKLFFSLLRSCDTACADFRGKNKWAVLLATFHSLILFLICMESIEKNTCCDLALSSTVSRLLDGQALLRSLPVPSITGYCATCHLQSGLLLRGFPTGCLFVFRGSIKLSWHLAWILSCIMALFSSYAFYQHNRPLLKYNTRLLLCASLSWEVERNKSVLHDDIAIQVINSNWYK